MSLVFIESFATTSYANISSRWETVGGDTTILATGGRTGGPCFRQTNTMNRVTRKYLAESSTYTMGVALNFGYSIYPASLSQLFGFTSGNDHYVVGLYLDPNGYFKLYNTSGTATINTLLATSSIVVPLNTWVFLEWKAVIGASGSSILKINEQEAFNVSGVNMRNTTYSDTGVSAVQYGGAGTGGIASGSLDIRWHDFYLTNATGSAPYNGFLGDVRILPLFPSGAGNYSAWTPSAGSNYENVDEASGTWPDGDTSYNQTLTANAKDTFAYQDISGSGNVLGVQHNLYARKTDAGTRFIAPMSRQTSTDYVSGTQHSLYDSYYMFTQCQQVNPKTSADWTISDINNAEFGYRLES